jgi:hypothetical protein
VRRHDQITARPGRQIADDRGFYVNARLHTDIVSGVYSCSYHRAIKHRLAPGKVQSMGFDIGERLVLSRVGMFFIIKNKHTILSNQVKYCLAAGNAAVGNNLASLSYFHHGHQGPPSR